jgi:hypothetical protein
MQATVDSVAFLAPRWLDFRGRWRIVAKVTVLDEGHRMVAEGVLDFTESDRPALPHDLQRFAEAVQARVDWYLSNDGLADHHDLAKLREAGPPKSP